MGVDERFEHVWVGSWMHLFFRWRKFVETNDHAAAILLCFGCYVPIHLPKSLLVALLHYT